MPDIPEILHDCRVKIVPAAEAKKSGGERHRCRRQVLFSQFTSWKYELRSSIDGGWNITHIYVVVDQEQGRNQKIEVEMSLGT